METGKLVRAIRLNKKLKAKDVYTDILTRPASIRFERGESDTTTERLFLILQRLNISLDEFYFLYYSSRENPLFQILEELVRVHKLSDGESLLILERGFSAQYEKTSYLGYLHYACIARLLATTYVELPYPKKQVEIILDYLFQIQSWNYYELVLFNNALDFIPSEMVDTVYSKVRTKMQGVKEMRRYKNELFTLISNILVVRIEAGDVKGCLVYWQELRENIAVDNTRMYETTMVYFFREAISLLENPTWNLAAANSILDAFGYLGMEHKKNQCLQLLEHIKQNHQKK